MTLEWKSYKRSSSSLDPSSSRKYVGAEIQERLLSSSVFRLNRLLIIAQMKFVNNSIHEHQFEN